MEGIDNPEEIRELTPAALMARHIAWSDRYAERGFRTGVDGRARVLGAVVDDDWATVLYRQGYMDVEPPREDHPAFNRHPTQQLLMRRHGDGWRVGSLNGAVGGTSWWGPGVLAAIPLTICGGPEAGERVIIETPEPPGG